MVSLVASATESVHVLHLVQKVSRVHYGQCFGSDTMWVPGFNTHNGKEVRGRATVRSSGSSRELEISSDRSPGKERKEAKSM